jgi:uncharacterized membrane protein YozB (DUF420 family)
MELLRGQPGFLGTGATMMADLTLLAYVLLIVPGMLAGFYFARRRKFEPQHKYTMTIIMMVNWVLIGFLMLVSYRSGVAPNVPQGLAQPVFLLPTIHLVTGAIAQLLGTYLVLRMWFEDVLPGWLKVKRIKRYMRFTLAMWLITALLGVSIYFVWYVLPPSGVEASAPVATPEVGATPEIDGPAVTPDGVAQTPEAEPSPVTTPEPVPQIEPDPDPEPPETPELNETPEVDD